MWVATTLLRWLWMQSFFFFGVVFLLPLLASRKLRENYFVFFYQFADTLWADALTKVRSTALGALNGIESHDPELRKLGALRLLEVGAGTGANFKHINRPLKYTNVDPNKEFGSIFQKELKKNPKGGRLIFLEHVAHPKGTWQRLVQDLAQPLWKVITCNCHITREGHEELMRAAGFSKVKINCLLADIPVLVNRNMYGCAVA